MAGIIILRFSHTVTHKIKMPKLLNVFLTVNERRGSKENLVVVLVLKRRLKTGYVHLIFGTKREAG